MRTERTALVRLMRISRNLTGDLLLRLGAFYHACDSYFIAIDDTPNSGQTVEEGLAVLLDQWIHDLKYQTGAAAVLLPFDLSHDRSGWLRIHPIRAGGVFIQAGWSDIPGANFLPSDYGHITPYITDFTPIGGAHLRCHRSDLIATIRADRDSFRRAGAPQPKPHTQPPRSPRPPTQTREHSVSETYHRDDLTIDQQLALTSAAHRLQEEFDGVFGVQTIERFLHSSYDQFATTATIQDFLPLLAERFARQRLHALARIEGHHDGRPIVLFLCVHNAGRSQIAMGFFQHLAQDHAVAWSGGSEPTTSINPAAVHAMAEHGIDITGEFPKPWTEEIVQAADVVVTMGCGDACPIYPGKRYLDWTLDDPAGKTVEEIRPIRDEIEQRVRHLLNELDIPTSA